MMIEHHIERHIVEQLIYAGTVSFSQLKPPELMNSAFDYHLKALLRGGLVAKVADGYQLTPEGLAYADKLSFKTRRPRQQPKLIAIFALQNAAGHWLLAERKIEPYLGQLMLPSGKQHLDESPEKHIVREIAEQVGVAVAVTRRGFADIRISQQGELLTHVSAHVYAGTYNGPVPAESAKFRYLFVDQPENNMLAGTGEIIEQLANAHSMFWLSLDLTDD